MKNTRLVIYVLTTLILATPSVSLAASQFIGVRNVNGIYAVSNGLRVEVKGLYQEFGYSRSLFKYVTKSYLDSIPLAQVVKSPKSNLWYIIKPGAEGVVYPDDYAVKYPGQIVPVADVPSAYINSLEMLDPKHYSSATEPSAIPNLNFPTTPNNYVATTNNVPVGTITVYASPFKGINDTFPGGINNNGVVVGNALANITNHGGSPVAWDSDGGRMVPGSRGSFGEAIDINDGGTIIGNHSFSDDGDSFPFVYENKKFKKLNLIGHAQAVNNSGTVVGEYNPDNNTGNGFMYKNGKITKLPFALYSVNDSNVAVGILNNKTDDFYEGIVWDGKKVTKLNYQEGVLVHPGYINNRGQVLGYFDARPGSAIGESYAGKTFIWENGNFTLVEPLLDHLIKLNDLGQGISGYTVWQDGVEIKIDEIISPNSDYVPGHLADINNASQVLATCWHRITHISNACVIQLPTNLKEYLSKK